MSDSALDFEGQSVVVTGGATGIGEACARLFAGRGASVTVMDIDAGGAERVAGEVRAAGGDAHVSAVDLTDWPATKGAIEAAHHWRSTRTILPILRRIIFSSPTCATMRSTSFFFCASAKLSRRER
jgi:NAD(P)-dependent dehydrogenase (short-subunit alcohol dehydrogenase family)